MRPNSAEAKAFVVIDLVSQQEAVRRVVAGWTEEEIVDWLSTKGELTCRDIQGQCVYFFSSRSAERLRAGLVMREHQMIVLPC